MINYDSFEKRPIFVTKDNRKLA